MALRVREAGLERLEVAMDRAHAVFLKVAETGNVTAASRELNVAQPSLTRTINKLEEDFGTRLFNRLPRGMELTPAGEVLFRHLTQMNAIYQRARRDVAAVHKGYHETVRIGSGLTYQLLLMPHLLRRLWTRFPHTSFQVFTGSADYHSRSLVEGELDIVISAADDQLDDPTLDVTRLGPIQHGIAHRKGTLPDIPVGQPMPLTALEGHDWILFQMDARLKSSIDERFFLLNLPLPRVALVTTSLQLGLEVVDSQGLIMSVPTNLRERLGRQGFLVHRTSEPIWRHDSWIAMHSANRGHPVLDAVVEETMALIEEIPAFDEFRQSSSRSVRND